MRVRVDNVLWTISSDEIKKYLCVIYISVYLFVYIINMLFVWETKSHWGENKYWTSDSYFQSLPIYRRSNNIHAMTCVLVTMTNTILVMRQMTRITFSYIGKKSTSDKSWLFINTTISSIHHIALWPLFCEAQNMSKV